ncbi:hypothetical protein WKW80_32450 [Variovorax humicola]|uniref:Uncharacterized protein n=1 Tax=Variovorax humicola TaxID=1769758 RepID=A0ABU8WBB6_9BURK
MPLLAPTDNVVISRRDRAQPTEPEIVMENRWCSACGCEFSPRPQAPRQAYCTKPECRRERRRLWQMAKRRSDPDYLANQTQAQKAWAARNINYWKQYRTDHPSYAANNRSRQRSRNNKRKQPSVAKMDLSQASDLLETGHYELRRIGVSPVANMDPWIVKITVLSRAAGPSTIAL